MSSKKDLRNIKQTQFDRGQVLKGSYSELNSGLRTVPTNAILRDVYTHFIQTLHQYNGYPVEVTYYQATEPAKDTITFVEDVAGNLAGTRIILEEFLTQKTHCFYYVVDSVGSPPSSTQYDTSTPIPISENDTASTIAYATRTVLDTIDDFIVTSNGPLSNSISLEYFQFGETSAINVTTTGFSVTRDESGNSVEVGHVEIEYDDNDYPIYGGNSLKGMMFNTFTGSFEPSFFDLELRREMATLVNLKTLEMLGIPLTNYVVVDDQIVTTQDGNLVKKP